MLSLFLLVCREVSFPHIIFSIFPLTLLFRPLAFLLFLIFFFPSLFLSLSSPKSLLLSPVLSSSLLSLSHHISLSNSALPLSHTSSLTPSCLPSPPHLFDLPPQFLSVRISSVLPHFLFSPCVSQSSILDFSLSLSISPFRFISLSLPLCHYFRRLWISPSNSSLPIVLFSPFLSLSLFCYFLFLFQFSNSPLFRRIFLSLSSISSLNISRDLNFFSEYSRMLSLSLFLSLSCLLTLSLSLFRFLFYRSLSIGILSLSFFPLNFCLSFSLSVFFYLLVSYFGTSPSSPKTIISLVFRAFSFSLFQFHLLLCNPLSRSNLSLPRSTTLSRILFSLSYLVSLSLYILSTAPKSLSILYPPRSLCVLSLQFPSRPINLSLFTLFPHTRSICPLSIHLFPHYFSLFNFLRKAPYLALYSPPFLHLISPPFFPDLPTSQRILSLFFSLLLLFFSF